MIIHQVFSFVLLYATIAATTVTAEPALLNISPEQLYNIYTTNENCVHLADEINTAQITADMSKDTRSISRTLSLIRILYRCYQDLSNDCASLEKVRSAGRKLCTLMITQNIEACAFRRFRHSIPKDDATCFRAKASVLLLPLTSVVGA